MPIFINLCKMFLFDRLKPLKAEVKMKLTGHV